jgi:hypothetical protein
LSDICSSKIINEFKERSVLESTTKILEDGYKKPGPTIFEEIRKQDIKITLHDKRGLRTNDSNAK